MDGWKTIVSFWDGFLVGAMLVSGRACHLPIHMKESRDLLSFDINGIFVGSPSSQKGRWDVYNSGYRPYRESRAKGYVIVINVYPMAYGRECLSNEAIYDIKYIYI